MKEKLLFDDWGQVPVPPPSPWVGVRTLVEIILIAACVVGGLLLLMAGCVLYLVVLAVLLCASPFVVAYHLLCNTATEGATAEQERSTGGAPTP